MVRWTDDLKRLINQVGDGGKYVMLLNRPVSCHYLLLLIYLWRIVVYIFTKVHSKMIFGVVVLDCFCRSIVMAMD
jgi:hypothetical protein